MLLLKAPYPLVQTISVLPNPTFSDGEGLADTVQTKRMMDGTLYTYVKTKSGRRRMQWTFNLTRNKGAELRAFFQSYFRAAVLVTDHNERAWLGHFTSSPFEFETVRRAAPNISPLPGELQTVTIEFEGIEQA